MANAWNGNWCFWWWWRSVVFVIEDARILVVLGELLEPSKRDNSVRRRRGGPFHRSSSLSFHLHLYIYTSLHLYIFSSLHNSTTWKSRTDLAFSECECLKYPRHSGLTVTLDCHVAGTTTPLGLGIRHVVICSFVHCCCCCCCCHLSFEPVFSL